MTASSNVVSQLGTLPDTADPSERSPKPLTEGTQSTGILIALWAFVVLPFVALLVAVPVALGLGPDLARRRVGPSVLRHHHAWRRRRFPPLPDARFVKAKRWLRIALTVAGSSAIEGGPIQWVADHRRHHAFSDREGDPHSPWRFGESFAGLVKGLFYAHVGWLFRRELTNRDRFAPDLMADKDIRRIDKLFPVIVILSVTLPSIIGGLVTWSWQGALSAFFWAGLIRIGLLHHVTWSINSVCHVYGERPFTTREGDRASNFWPLALLSFGESWHNLHHADPTSARHGVDRANSMLTPGSSGSSSGSAGPPTSAGRSATVSTPSAW
jgi:stearoyl-CoA desaturase (delta-9 desaturase)